MKKAFKKWFTLVELLVVITILSIISIVAYQNFGWAINKANNSRKQQDIEAIKSGLERYYVEKNFFPPVDLLSTQNKYWYDSSKTANPSNTLTVTKNWVSIDSISSANGGWKVMWINWYSSNQIWAKWTISQDTLGKQYLTKDVYDPELWDIKVWTKKFIEEGIWRYIYAVYKKPVWANWWTTNNTWTSYNIAYTVKKDGSEDYMTIITWGYDEKICIWREADCPKTLIWSGDQILINNQVSGKKSDWSDLTNFDSTQTNQWIPYPLGNF